ncbi:MAG: hypothetical protein K1X72_24325 [Pyrinomonadaceae bacterium]|nr:hypothetical protein [Pyrinomonadaceae bacterium]
MGQLVIEVPQNIHRLFRIKDRKFTEKLLQELEQKEVKKSNIIPPRRNSLKEDGDAVLGIWADREEDALEIARKIRDKNNGKI